MKLGIEKTGFFLSGEDLVNDFKYLKALCNYIGIEYKDEYLNLRNLSILASYHKYLKKAL